MHSPQVSVKNVLVTGCSSGIGAATARLLKEKGWQVIPTVRKAEDLERLKAGGFDPVAMDLADSASVTRGVAQVLEAFQGRIGALVNNAGFGQPGAMEDLTRDAMRYQFEVNVFGLQELTNKLVPVFRKQGYGRVVNVSSVLGRIIIPFMGAYSASKYAVEAMSQALRVELRGSGVMVSVIEPGPIETAFRKTTRDRGREQLAKVQSVFARRYEEQLTTREIKKKFTHHFMLPPEAVARKILHALESDCPRRRYQVTLPAYVGACLSRFAPDALLEFLVSHEGVR